MHHGDVPDDVGQALVEQREDDDVQSGPLGLETEPEAKPSAGGWRPPGYGLRRLSDSGAEAETAPRARAGGADGGSLAPGDGAPMLLWGHRGGPTGCQQRVEAEGGQPALRQESSLWEQPPCCRVMGGGTPRDLQNQGQYPQGVERRGRAEPTGHRPLWRGTNSQVRGGSHSARREKQGSQREPGAIV